MEHIPDVAVRVEVLVLSFNLLLVLYYRSMLMENLSLQIFDIGTVQLYQSQNQSLKENLPQLSLPLRFLVYVMVPIVLGVEVLNP